jgi:hypothetical protein
LSINEAEGFDLQEQPSFMRSGLLWKAYIVSIK